MIVQRQNLEVINLWENGREKIGSCAKDWCWLTSVVLQIGVNNRIASEKRWVTEKVGVNKGGDVEVARDIGFGCHQYGISLRGANVQGLCSVRCGVHAIHLHNLEVMVFDIEEERRERADIEDAENILLASFDGVDSSLSVVYEHTIGNWFQASWVGR